MSDENKRHLGYKPDIKYEDEYYSDVNKDDTDVMWDTSGDTTGTGDTGTTEKTYDDLFEDVITRLEDHIGNLPKKLEAVIRNVYEPVKDFYINDIRGKDLGNFFNYKSTSYNQKHSSDIDYSVGKGDTDSSGGPGNGETEVDPDAFWGTDDFLDVIVTYNDLKTAIENSYIKNVIDLIGNYFDELDNTLSSFWFNSLTPYYNVSKSNVELINNDLTLKHSDLVKSYSHMVEFCRRNEINKHLKSDFSLRMFNFQETISHMKGFKIAYEFKQRYAESEFKSNSDALDAYSDNILEGMMQKVDEKYDRAFERTYKYLLSSVDVLDDILKSYMHEIRSKNVMNTKGINK